MRSLQFPPPFLPFPLPPRHPEMQARHTRDNNSLIPIAKAWAIRLLTESPYYWHLFSLIFIGQVALCALVIRYVACERFLHQIPSSMY